jgi:hypothetical protein
MLVETLKVSFISTLNVRHCVPIFPMKKILWIIFSSMQVSMSSPVLMRIMCMKN